MAVTIQPSPLPATSAEIQNQILQAQFANLQWRSINAPETITQAERNSPAGLAVANYANQMDMYGEATKIVQAYAPLAGINVGSLANVPLSEIATRYGGNVADAVQGFFTANPTAKAQEILNAAEQQRTNIIGSSGVQQYLGETLGGNHIYSEAGGSTPFRATVLTDYQKGAVDTMVGATQLLERATNAGFIPASVASAGIVGGLSGIRGIETAAPLIVSDFIGKVSPAQPQSVQAPSAVVTSPVGVPSGSNFISDFFGGFAKGGFAAGAGAINPAVPSGVIVGSTPIYEMLNQRTATPSDLGIGVRGISDIGSSVLDAGKNFIEGIVPRANAVGGGALVNDTLYPAPFRSTVASSTTPVTGVDYGNIVAGPVRSEKEAIGLNQIATAAQIDVVSRPGYYKDAPVGSQHWAENYVELSEAYHNIAEKTGKQQPANPYEYQGDLALAYLKGTNKESKSSVYGENITDTSALKLPGGLGVQDVAWQKAEAGKGGERAAVEVPAGYETAVAEIQKSAGHYGPYGALYGGKADVVAAPAPDWMQFRSENLSTKIGEPFYPTTVVKTPESLGSFGGIVSGATSLYGAGRNIAISGLSDIGSYISQYNPQKSSTPFTGVQNKSYTTVYGGNQTITALGNWIDVNRDKVDRSDIAQVSEFNAAVDTYSKMQEQNPIITKTTTESTITTTSQGGQLTGEQQFLSGVYGKIGLPQSVDIGSIISGAGSAIGSGISAIKSSPFGGAVVGAVAANPMADFFGGEVGSGVSIYDLAAVNPLALGAGIGVIGVIKLEQMGVLGLTGPTEGASVRSYGGQAGSFLYTKGYEFAGASRTALNSAAISAQEMWEGGGAPINVPGAWNLPKITDVTESPVFKAPGEGYQQIVNLPGEGLQIIAGLPGAGRNLIAKTEGAISLPFSGGGAGVIQMPKSTITPEDVIAPVFGYTSRVQESVAAIPRMVTERAIFDLSVNTEAKSVIATKEAVVSQFAPDYATKLANIAAAATGVGTAIATPYWWARTDYASRVQEQNAIANPFADVYSGTNVASKYQSGVQSEPQAVVSPLVSTRSITAQQIQNLVENQYQTITGSRGRSTLEKIDYKIEFPLPNLGGSGGGAGGYLTGRKKVQREFLYIGPNPRSKPLRMPKMRKPKRK